MQHIKIIGMGKLSEAFYAAGVQEYMKRLSPCCKIEMEEIPEEVVDEKTASASLIAAALKREAEKLMAAVPKGARIVALCVEGQHFGSEEFAKWLDNAAISGNGSVAFIIGSSHGLAPEVKQQAELKLSLSDMTLPHQLARLMLTEQIYRAFMIRNGSKYHK